LPSLASSETCAPWPLPVEPIALGALPSLPPGASAPSSCGSGTSTPTFSKTAEAACWIGSGRTPANASPDVPNSATPIVAAMTFSRRNRGRTRTTRSIVRGACGASARVSSRRIAAATMRSVVASSSAVTGRCAAITRRATPA
jgi:hypothetical protein